MSEHGVGTQHGGSVPPVYVRTESVNKTPTKILWQWYEKDKDFAGDDLQSSMSKFPRGKEH